MDKVKKSPKPSKWGKGKTDPKTWWKKGGPSPNPAGRPKGALGLKTVLATELKSTIKIQEAGKTKTVTKQQAMVKQFVSKALKGDDKAFGRLIPLMLAIGAEEMADTDHALTDQQKEILKRNAQRLLETLSKKESGQ